MYGHIAKLAESEKKGIEEAGGKVDVYQYVPKPPNSSRLPRPTNIIRLELKKPSPRSSR